jgi:hypothetical protein
MPRTPYPMPFGWFAVAWPDEVTVDGAEPFECFDRSLVAWRDDTGSPHVADAYRRERRYPALDRNGVVQAWYHPDPEVMPLWEVPVVHALDDPDWHERIRGQASIDNHLQELAENQVDTAHFRFVHRNATVPEIETYEPSFPGSVMRAKQFFTAADGETTPGRLEVESCGPGMSVVRFGGLVDTIDVAHSTPVSLDRTTIRSQFRVRSLGDPGLTAVAAQVFAAEVQRQMVEEDGPIWTHKAHIANPALADGDGPVLRFRRWFAQFYAEEASADGRWEPPWWPDRADEAPAGQVSSAALMLELAAQPPK